MGPGILYSNQLPGDTKPAGPRTTLMRVLPGVTQIPTWNYVHTAMKNFSSVSSVMVSKSSFSSSPVPDIPSVATIRGISSKEQQ